jgi:hypothetical protein
MPSTLGQLIFDAFGGKPESTTMHLIERVYHVLLPDHGVSFDVVVPKGLIKNGKLHKVPGDFAVGFALVNFEQQNSDRKIWLGQRFRKHLEEARELAKGWWRAQVVLGEEWEKHHAKKR